MTRLIDRLQAMRNTLAHDEYSAGDACPRDVRTKLRRMDRWLAVLRAVQGRMPC